MRSFKEAHYDPMQRLRCRIEESPYDDPRLCHVPAYVPARLPLPSESQLIPRVVFISWTTRKLGRSMFTSIMTILHHNPEYELIFFTDVDVDRFVCANFPQFAPPFSKLRAGAARIDVWRMLVIYQFGGVYLDVDMSALGHLPIAKDAAAVSGLGGWSHLPASTGGGGVLEHWALAYKPKHLLINKTIEIIMDNLRDPNNTQVEGIEAQKAERSYVIRLTGPGPYQRALQHLLRQSQCKTGGSFVPAIRDPGSHCNMTAFHDNFGNLVIVDLDLNTTITPKILDSHKERYILGHKHYNNEDVKRPMKWARPDFCSEGRFGAQKAESERLWVEAIKEKKRKGSSV